MPVIVDLNWDCFSRNTLLWEYNHLFSLCGLVASNSLPDQQNKSGTVISGLFTQSACGTYGCPLNLENAEVVLYLLRSVLRMYRDEFHIDGLRFITKGSQSLGGSCEKNGTVSTDDVALSDFWEEVRALGFFIVGVERGVSGRSPTTSRPFQITTTSSTSISVRRSTAFPESTRWTRRCSSKSRLELTTRRRTRSCALSASGRST